MKEREKIIEVYSQEDIAKTFDEERNEFLYQKYKHQFEAKILTKSIKNLKNPKVLDVACGTGRMLPVIFEANGDAEYFGLDTSNAMTSLLNKKADSIGKKERTHVIIGDAAKMPFENNTFDVVFTYHLLWHLPLEEQKRIIKEMLRVCKKGGIVIFDTLNKDFIWERMKNFFGRKKTKDIYKISINEIKGIIGKKGVKIDKLSDAIIRNDLLYSAYNIINLLRMMIPKSLYHMLYVKVEK